MVDWCTDKHFDVCDILDIDIEVEDVVGFIWVGVPMKVPTIERPALETHVKVLQTLVMRPAARELSVVRDKRIAQVCHRLRPRAIGQGHACRLATT